MTSDKTTRQNRVREALGRIYDQQPPYFREYLRRFQEDPTSRVFAPLAEAYRRLGRVDEAIEICREGLEHHPDFHGGRVALAKCFLDKKKYAEAKAELERVVHAVPENLLAQRLLGDANQILGQVHAALHCYKMALLLSPSDVGLAEKVHALEKQAQEISSEEDLPAEQDSPAEELAAAASPEPEPIEEAPPPLPERAGPTPFASPMKDPFTDEEMLAPVNETSYTELGLKSPSVDEILGVTDDEEAEESFRIEHVSAIFEESRSEKQKEITTATLGDLYFSQGQYDRALRIFEKLQAQRPLPELLRKINACRMKMGVDREAVTRNRKIEALRHILDRVKSSSGASGNP